MTNSAYPDMFVLHLASLLDSDKPSPKGSGKSRWALDAGCGSGRNSRFLAASGGWRVCGLDASREMLRKGRDALTILTPTNVNGGPLSLPSPSRGEGWGEGPSFVQGRLERLPFSPETFQVVICTHVLESLSRRAGQQAAEEFRRVLKPGGWLLVVVPSQGKFGSKEELLGWFMDFKVVELFHLKLEEPATSSVKGQWALIARKELRLKG